MKDYYQKAQENEQIMNGTREAGQDASTMQAPQVDPNAAPAPTANDLAKPTIPENQAAEGNGFGN